MTDSVSARERAKRALRQGVEPAGAAIRRRDELARDVLALVEENERRYADAVGLREQLYTDEKLWEINAALEAENKRLQRVAEAAREYQEHEQNEPHPGEAHIEWESLLYHKEAALSDALVALAVGEE